MPRLFVAIAIDAAVIERLAAVRVEGPDEARAEVSVAAPSELAAEVSDAAPDRPRGTWRSVKPAAMHLTLAFLGDVDAARVPAVLEAMTAAAAGVAPFDLTAEGVGAFPNASRARVLWAGVAGDVAVLAGLQADLATRLSAEGFALEDRAYRPHITLARARVPGPVPVAVASGPRFGRWHVSELKLIESHLGTDGSRYEVRGTAALGG